MIGEKEKLEIVSIAQKRGLDLVVLFGSQVTRRLHSKSDIDIAVIGKQALAFDKQLDLIGDFYTLFKREDVEVVDLATASPTLMYVVVRDGKLLYERQENIFFRWKLYAIKIWMETAWLRELRNKKLIEWADTHRQANA